MHRILVTGATGNVASRVVGQLQERGALVRAFVRDPGKATKVLGDALGDTVEIAVGDFSDVPSVRRALDGVDAVFLACANHPRQVEHEIGAIDQARDAGVRRIVKLSAFGAEIGSPVAFWDWHGRIEEHLQESEVPSVVLRPSFAMTNVLGSAEQIRHTGSLFLPADGASVAMIHPGDVAAAAATALADEGHDGHTYVLTGPEAITFAHVAHELSAVVGRQVRFVAVPDAAAQQALVASGMPEFVADQIVTVFGMLRHGVQERTTDAVRAIAGRTPQMFAAFARQHAQAFGP